MPFLRCPRPIGPSQPRHLCSFAALLIVATACSPPASGRFEVSGVDESVRTCFDIAFPFVPIFHAYRERSNSFGLFFQSRGGTPQFTDTVYFEVFTPSEVVVGEALTVEPVVGLHTQVAGAVDLSESCPAVGVLGTTTNKPSLLDTLGIVGTLTFDQFEEEIDGTIAGRVEGELVDREGIVVAEQFTGDFEFTLQVGQPYEEFRN